MSVSKKDFEAIAEQFKRERERLDEQDYLDSTTREFMACELDRMCERLACVFLAANRNFKVATFLSACGVRTDLLIQTAENVRNGAVYFGVIASDATPSNRVVCRNVVSMP